MSVYQIYKDVISRGDYNVSSMEARIETVFAQGKLTEAEYTELMDMTADNANDSKQIDVASAIADLQERMAKLESQGVVVWVSGKNMVTAKGQTVLYDVFKDGTLRYCTYMGGRSSTTLAPCRIDGWVVRNSLDGAVTHKTIKTENGTQLVAVESAE